MLLTELVGNSLPWPGTSNVDAAIAVCTKAARTPISPHASPLLVEIIEKCWQQQPQGKQTNATLFSCFSSFGAFVLVFCCVVVVFAILSCCEFVCFLNFLFFFCHCSFSCEHRSTNDGRGDCALERRRIRRYWQNVTMNSVRLSSQNT